MPLNRRCREFFSTQGRYPLAKKRLIEPGYVVDRIFAAKLNEFAQVTAIVLYGVCGVASDDFNIL
jgi:hypothetical protein